MKLKLTDLEIYSSPFGVWHDEFFSTMEDLVSFSGSQDDLLLLLFNRVLPFVKHQYVLYDSLVPAMECMAELLDRQPEDAESVMSFLTYVFQEQIRETNYVLVDPVQYRYLEPTLMAPTAFELSLFASMKQFYEMCRRRVQNVSLRDYFDVTLLDRFEGEAVLSDDDSRVSRLLAGAMMRFKHGKPFIQETGVNMDGDEYEDLGSALQGRDFSDQSLYRLLENDTLVDHIPWAGGRLGVIAGLTLFFAASREDARVQVLERLVHVCAGLKQGREEDEVDRLMTDQFLLEDLSVALFRKQLSAKHALDTGDLDDVQRSFLTLLQKVYRGHTYALLYAGLLPDGADINEIGLCSSIYDC